MHQFVVVIHFKKETKLNSPLTIKHLEYIFALNNSIAIFLKVLSTVL